MGWAHRMAVATIVAPADPAVPCDTSPMPTHEDLAARLERGAQAILSLAPAVQAAGPWPLAELYGTEAEASWGPPELLAHVDEMLPFWLGEVERILEGSADTPVPFGRVADDVIRIGIIGRDRTVPLRELFARLAADSRRVAARMRELSATELAREGLHPRLDVMSVAALLERFVVAHVEDHDAQLRAILAERG